MKYLENFRLYGTLANQCTYLLASSPSTANTRLAAKPWSLSTTTKSPMMEPVGSFSGMVRLRDELLNCGGLSLMSNTTTVTNDSDDSAGDPPSVATTCRRSDEIIIMVIIQEIVYHLTLDI